MSCRDPVRAGLAPRAFQKTVSGQTPGRFQSKVFLPGQIGHNDPFGQKRRVEPLREAGRVQGFRPALRPQAVIQVRQLGRHAETVQNDRQGRGVRPAGKGHQDRTGKGSLRQQGMDEAAHAQAQPRAGAGKFLQTSGQRFRHDAILHDTLFHETILWRSPYCGRNGT